MCEEPDKVLGTSFFARDTLTVARELLGCVIEVSAAGGAASGRIVETEAYLGREDPASHAGRGRTPRSGIMFGPPGVVYVYLIYGMHHCLNFVTEQDGTPGAVLIRALEPVAGRDLMARRRGLDAARCRDRDLTAGPGRLCRALGIDRMWNGRSLADPGSGIRVLDGASAPPEVLVGPRVGIRQAVELPYRFRVAGSGCLTD